MKVLAINGSPRRDGNTNLMLEQALKPIADAGMETEIVQLAGKTLRGCIACYKCFERKDRRCAVASDDCNALIAKMLEADAILLGSPTYFADVTAEMKALIDRAGLVAKANGDMFRRKVGAAVIAVRRGGEIHAFDTINHFFLIGQMVVPGSIYWNMGIGREKGEVAGDDEGMRTMTTLGENIAWLLQKIHA